jgi:phosphate acetyltransferase
VTCALPTSLPAPVPIAFGDAGDTRVLAAVAELAVGGLVQPVLVLPAADHAGVPEGVLTVQPGPDDGTDLLAFLARYVAQGRAAGGVAGSLSTSAAVIRAGLRGLGAKGVVVGSFLMERAGRRTTFADCSVVPEPTSDQLAQIAAAAADHHRLTTGEQPRVALLSFSTHGSASHPAVDRVRVVTEVLARRRPDLLVEGEVQLDVALDASVAARKLPSSAVAGDANVLVFPSLDAGNIAYKLAERWGGARALGSFVLNLQHPWVDLSRGCSQADIVDTALLLRQEVLARAAMAGSSTEPLGTGAR